MFGIARTVPVQVDGPGAGEPRDSVAPCLPILPSFQRDRSNWQTGQQRAGGPLGKERMLPDCRSRLPSS